MKNRSRWATLVFSLAVVAVPFFLVRFPPIADLPQQAAQIRLLGEALEDSGGLYRVQWTNPNTLAYAVLGAAWAVAGPLAAGRMAMLVLALAWVAAVHLLAWRRGRSPAAATLASILVFNGALYWGFYSFMLGFPIFVAWFLLSRRPPAVRRWLRGLEWFSLTLLLALSHLLWLAAGLLWLGLDSLWRFRHREKDGWVVSDLVVRALGVLPVTLYSLWWFSRLGETGFSSPAGWIRPLWRRLLPEYLVDAVLGGLRGPLEPLLVAALLAWVAVSVLSHRGLRGTDRPLAAVGLLFLGLCLVLPEKYSNTIQLNFRFAAPGMAFLLLAVPAPRLHRRWRALWAASVLAVGVILSGWVWMRFEADELSGLGAALEALPPDQRVVGLEFGQRSRFVEDRPLLQVFAYAQVARGGRLNFSFAEFGTSLVVYRERFEPPWTPGLEWYPRHVKHGDFRHFDYALISGDETVHRRARARGLLVPVTDSGRWRLYSVDQEGLKQLLPGAGPDGRRQRSILVPQRQ